MLFSSLDVSVSGSDEVASAVATCGHAMRQLRKLSIAYINPLPLLRALGDRDCPLEHVTVKDPPWVCALLVCVLTGLMMQCFSIKVVSCQLLIGPSSGVDRSLCCRVCMYTCCRRQHCAVCVQVKCYSCEGIPQLPFIFTSFPWLLFHGHVCSSLVQVCMFRSHCVSTCQYMCVHLA